MDEKQEAEQAAQDAKDRLKEIAPRLVKVEALAQKFSADPDELLPEAGALESARVYRDKKAAPLLKRLVSVLRDLYNRYLDAVQSLKQLQQKYDHEVGVLNGYILRLKGENEQLRPKVQQYDMLCKYLGQKHVDALLTAIQIKTHGIKVEDEIWEKWVEIKARRDLWVHNAGIANQIYLDKTKDYNLVPIGSEALIDQKYFSDSVATMKTLVGRIDRDIRKAYKNDELKD